MFAYVGPGAGLALAGSLFTLLFALLATVGLLLTWPVRSAMRWYRSRSTRKRAAVKRVVVLGLDGLDPRITETLLAEGLLPNLAKLQSQGSYQRLATTWPPLSPVAWSSFSTGVNPGKHAIFDFIRRDPATYQAEIATVRLRNPSARASRWWNSLRLFHAQPNIQPLRRSQSFWKVLSGHGIYSAVLRVPVTFPPERFYGVQLSAASVPDLRGTQGTYTHFFEPEPNSNQKSPHAPRQYVGQQYLGRWVLVRRRGEEIHALLPGPPQLLRADQAEMQKPIKLTRDAAGNISLHMDKTKLKLTPGEFSPWVRVSFRLGLGKKVAGICRFLLNRWETPFSLYCTPLQLDPAQPAMPISFPAVFSRYLAARQGTFATLGLAEDTNALTDGVLSKDAFLNQAASIHAEREQMFFDMLRRVKRGMIACVFDGPDRIQHMFWNRPMGEAASDSVNEVLQEHYRRWDNFVGRTMQACDAQTALLVLSDHGFQAFRMAVDLNAWLQQEGYLHWKRAPTSDRPTTIEDIDWFGTQAYAFGLTGLYLNQQGREAAGIVPPGEASQALIKELCAKLSGWKDEQTGEVAILEAVPRTAVFTGPYVKQAPDILIGYNAGYRAHSQSALGGSLGEVLTANNKPWCGDHCQHPAVVPGVLFSNRVLRSPPDSVAESSEQAKSWMIDIAPTVLDLLGVTPPAYMDGKSLRCDDVTSSE